jgi:asparagine synthase (glutamine-hydrolysing)
MSFQFGRWNTDGKPVDLDYLEKVKSVIAPYGPDGAGSCIKAGIAILYGAFYTTKESRRETQPHITAPGLIITWDGRLDNRQELIRELPKVLTINSTDVSIVAAAYEEWGSDCFAKLIGDWAVSIWDANSRSLVLAKDPIGARHLYYSIEKDQVIWSTILDPLVLFAGHSFALNEEYIAGWFSFFPAAHLTPYVGIHSVPPSSSVLIREGKHAVTKYWDFDPYKEIRYGTNAEYEEHFRAAFTEAVRRRLRSDCPILAELSGGMDSSSIVCIADTIIARGSAETPRLDTVSYYDDSEHNWNERPYFTKVEERRGRTGCHIDASSLDVFDRDFAVDHFAATPGSVSRPNETAMRYSACIVSGGNRVVLSGLGGDEVTGGVPTPVPELADLLAACRWRSFAHQLKTWALTKRKPWLHLLFGVIRTFLPPSMTIAMNSRRPAPWIRPDFVGRNATAFHGAIPRIHLFGPRPSFQDNLLTLDGLCRSLTMTPLPSSPVYEKRYSYLDRDFLEFLFSIPPEQQLRPGHRRSLMRRALVDMVPPEILGRKRKAFMVRTLATSLSNHWQRLFEKTDSMTCVSLDLIDPDCFKEALQKASDGAEIPTFPLLRTLSLETWLKNVVKRGILQCPQIQVESMHASTLHSVSS